MRVITSYICPPIPMRGNDWAAYLEKHEGQDGAPCGYGFTKIAALEDLLSQLDDDKEYNAVVHAINDIEERGSK